MLLETPTVVSHGERAVQLDRAQLATRLSDLTATTADLFELIAAGVRGDDERLIPVRQLAGELAESLPRLLVEPPATVSYRRLVPFLTVSEAIGDNEELRGLLEELPSALAEQNLGREAANQLAERLRGLSQAFEAVGLEALVAVGEPDGRRS